MVRRLPRAFFEEGNEIGRVFKTQAITYLRQTPVAVPQQGFRFGDYLTGDMLGRGSAGHFFQRFIEVIGMNTELPGKLIRVFEEQRMLAIGNCWFKMAVNRELMRVAAVPC